MELAQDRATKIRLMRAAGLPDRVIAEIMGMRPSVLKTTLWRLRRDGHDMGCANRGSSEYAAAAVRFFEAWVGLGRIEPNDAAVLIVAGQDSAAMRDRLDRLLEDGMVRPREAGRLSDLIVMLRPELKDSVAAAA